MQGSGFKVRRQDGLFQKCPLSVHGTLDPFCAIYKMRVKMTEKMNQNNGPKLNDQMLIRREKLEKIRALGVEPYGQKFDYDHHASDIRQQAE